MSFEHCLAGAQKSKKSKYGNRKVIRDGIKFDSEREAARFGELKVLRAMGKIRDLRLQANFTLVEGYTTIEGERIKPMVYRADFVYERATGTAACHPCAIPAARTIARIMRRILRRSGRRRPKRSGRRRQKTIIWERASSKRGVAKS